MDNSLPFSSVKKRKIIIEILNFFPFSIFIQIIGKNNSKQNYNLKLYNYLKHSSFQYNKSIVNMVMKKNPEQIILLSKEIFLPIYAIFASGMHVAFYYPYLEVDRNYNNSFSVNDYLFNIYSVLYRSLAIIGGMYYSIEAEKYYSFLEEFKLPDEAIKIDYIQTYIPKLSKILEENNITFTDFEYYTFYQNTAYFYRKIKEKKKKVNLSGIDKKYIDFYQKNPYYDLDIKYTEDPYGEIAGISNSFLKENSTLSFVIKKFRFFFIKKNITFTIYCIKKKGNIEKLEKECHKISKVPDLTQEQDKLTITEFYSKDWNSIEPVLTLTSLDEKDYYEYSLKHFRFGKYILISYQKKENEDCLPKIYSYGSLLNL